VGRVFTVHLKKEAVRKAQSSDKFDNLPSDFNRGSHQKINTLFTTRVKMNYIFDPPPLFHNNFCHLLASKIDVYIHMLKLINSI